jgi:hypothetical protein
LGMIGAPEDIRTLTSASRGQEAVGRNVSLRRQTIVVCTAPFRIAAVLAPHPYYETKSLHSEQFCALLFASIAGSTRWRRLPTYSGTKIEVD